jgi:small multidrug resistance family-3 protein
LTVSSAARRGPGTLTPTFQSDDNFGRILAAYGGIFVAGSIAWGMVADGYRPDRWNLIGILVRP